MSMVAKELMGLRWWASNDTRDRAIIGGMVPNHRSRALQQQPSKMLCRLSSSKAVGHPLTASTMLYVLRTVTMPAANLGKIQHCFFCTSQKSAERI